MYKMFHIQPTESRSNVLFKMLFTDVTRCTHRGFITVLEKSFLPAEKLPTPVLYA